MKTKEDPFIVFFYFCNLIFFYLQHGEPKFLCWSDRGTFWRIVKHGSTEEFESFPYICTLLGSSLWTYYGIIKPGSYLVATINGFGVVADIVYVSLFLIFAPPRLRATIALLAGILDVGFVAATILVTHFAMQGDLRINVLGFLCSGLNIAMYGSPLAVMKTVVTTKSVEYMPFLFSFLLFFNGGLWTFYGYLQQDLFVLVSNGAGFVLGIAQMVLYAIYWKSKPSKSCLSDELEGEQEHLLPPSSDPPHDRSQA